MTRARSTRPWLPVQPQFHSTCADIHLRPGALPHRLLREARDRTCPPAELYRLATQRDAETPAATVSQVNKAVRGLVSSGLLQQTAPQLKRLDQPPFTATDRGRAQLKRMEAASGLSLGERQLLALLIHGPLTRATVVTRYAEQYRTRRTLSDLIRSLEDAELIACHRERRSGTPHCELRLTELGHFVLDEATAVLGAAPYQDVV